MDESYGVGETPKKAPGSLDTGRGQICLGLF